MNCDHDKSYSQNILLSHPAKRRWICRKCMDEGIDVEHPAWPWNDYDALKRLKADSIDIKISNGVK